MKNFHNPKESPIFILGIFEHFYCKHHENDYEFFEKNNSVKCVTQVMLTDCNIMYVSHTNKITLTGFKTLSIKNTGSMTPHISVIWPFCPPLCKFQIWHGLKSLNQTITVTKNCKTAFVTSHFYFFPYLQSCLDILQGSFPNSFGHMPQKSRAFQYLHCLGSPFEDLPSIFVELLGNTKWAIVATRGLLRYNQSVLFLQ